jgi:hypothetical protein
MMMMMMMTFVLIMVRVWVSAMWHSATGLVLTVVVKTPQPFKTAGTMDQPQSVAVDKARVPSTLCSPKTSVAVLRCVCSRLYRAVFPAITGRDVFQGINISAASPLKIYEGGKV